MPPMMLHRRAVLALIGGALTSTQASAASYPSRPIKIIVPFGPGGSGDITARMIGKEIEERTKSTTSIMPLGLLSKLTREEILDLLAYVYAKGDKKHELFEGHHDH